LAQSIDDALERCDPDRHDPDELWREFEQDAAAYNTAVAKITGTDAADAEALEDFIGAELRQRINAVPLDASLLKTSLRMYQIFGAKYAIHQERSIIGDEMGLGKTIQALAVCAHLAAKGQRRFLVVCPPACRPTGSPRSNATPGSNRSVSTAPPRHARRRRKSGCAAEAWRSRPSTRSPGSRS